MALSIKRLRWTLAATALLLVLVLVALIGYGRFRALKIYSNLLHHAGATISHDTNGFTYSQTEKGRTLFTLHAARATQVGDGQWSLHDVKVTLYSRDGKHTDHIDGNEFTYDEKDGLVTAIGEVHMDLQAPQSLTSAGRSPAKPIIGEAPQTAAESSQVIHVRTSGLEYLRKLGVATTKEQVEFHYNGIECTGQGAEFITDQSTLRLLSNVVAHGVMRGQPVTIHASTAQVDRTSNVATLTHTVAESQGRTASADLTTLNLRQDGSIEAATATGHVALNGPTQRVTADALSARFTPQTVPQTARLSGGVQMTDVNPRRPTRGSAGVVDLSFDAQGALKSLIATQAPQLVMTDKRTLERGLSRAMHGDRIVASFASALRGSQPHAAGSHASSQLTELRASGSAEAQGESVAAKVQSEPPQLKTTTLTADDLDLTFSPGEKQTAEPQKLVAVGHTLLRQSAPAGEQESSAGDKLDAVFAQTEVHGRPELTLARAVQTGHVVVHRIGPEHAAAKPGIAAPQRAFGDATAEQASYDGSTEKLTLSANAHLTQDNATVTAVTVVLDERTQDADASGNVQATLANAQSRAGNGRPVPFTHVLAASAHFTHDSRQAEFRGTDAQPAKMWQDASQVQAATLLLDDAHRTFSARPGGANGLVHAVFAGTAASSSAAPQATRTASGRSRYVRVAAAKMDYSEPQREAVFTGAGGVTMEGDSGTIHAERAVAYLQPATAELAKAQPAASATPFSGSLDRIVITGNVQLEQPGRHGSGEQLVYTAATGDSVLTGSPGKLPRIVDAQQGSVAGPSLLFGDSGSTIIVSGESGTARPVRVHTETHIETKGKEERQ